MFELCSHSHNEWGNKIVDTENDKKVAEKSFARRMLLRTKSSVVVVISQIGVRRPARSVAYINSSTNGSNKIRHGWCATVESSPQWRSQAVTSPEKSKADSPAP
jgi:chlorite dismutase